MMTARGPRHLLLLDPPYRSGLGQKALTRLVAKGWIADCAWVSLETARDENVDVAGFAVDAGQIGRATCRERVCQSVLISVDDCSFKTQQKKYYKSHTNKHTQPSKHSTTNIQSLQLTSDSTKY